MKVEVMRRHGKGRINLDKLARITRKCAAGVLPADSVLSVGLISDAEMKEVNELYTGRRGVTDVLSFPLGRSVHDSRWYGEIIISSDRASNQAMEKGVKLVEEITRLIVHAIVHLAGLNHYTRERFKEMRRVELDLLMRCLDTL